jgi:archaemetzincin
MEKSKFQVPNKLQRMAAIGKIPADKILRGALTNVDVFYQPVPNPGPSDWLACHKENGQTYDQYVAYKKMKISMSPKNTLYFLPFQNLEKGLLLKCHQFCEAFFYGAKVKFMEPADIRATSVEHRINQYSGKIQYNALQIMHAAKAFFQKDAFATLSIMMDDLYPFDKWNFCYGWSEYKGGSGVFSLARYDPRFADGSYVGDPSAIILNRACKIMTHEMTHMFGIFHCIFFKCAMNGINTDEEASRSPLDLCPVCLRKLQSNIGFNILERYIQMEKVLSTFPSTFDDDKEWIHGRIEYLKSYKSH